MSADTARVSNDNQTDTPCETSTRVLTDMASIYDSRFNLRTDAEDESLLSAQYSSSSKISELNLCIVTPKSVTPMHRAVALQRWEGYVDEVLDETFSARLVDLSGDIPDEQAEFSKTEIANDDLDLLAPGAVFYWSLGYLDTPQGQRLRTSSIRLRRLPAWSNNELNAARQEAEHVARHLGWFTE